jgi:choline dehydrogenase-like flavoprotein
VRLNDLETANPDYIVVGGGPAGCVMAGRLSENPRVKVLLLEAGRDSDTPLVRLPVGSRFMVENEKWDWAWQTPPDPTLNGRHITWSAGKTLGGGSSIHGGVNIRCLPSDYDLWAEMIEEGTAWSYADLLPYFIGCESYEGGHDEYRGHSGPLAVSDIRDPHPLVEAFVAAGEDLGYERTDLNGKQPYGFAPSQGTQKDGRRFTAYDGYIRPHTGRPNLDICTNARVVRVRMENGVATGVEVSVGDTAVTVGAGREVIVSAGAIASANLLLKSGIGPADVLSAAGVPVALERNGVGRNLQEHGGLSLSRFIKGHWSLNSAQRPDRGARYMYQLLAKRRGPLAAPVVQGMGFVKTDPSLEFPDIQLHFLPFAYRMLPESTSALTAYMPKRAAVAIQATLCKPKVRGQVRITDADPLSAPAIDHQILGDPRDLETLVAASKLVTGIFKGPRFAGSVVENFNPSVDPSSEEGWEDFVRNNANGAYHHAGTCRMGRASDPDAVVDPSLRLIGAERLRVVDASVMPVVPSANTYIPTIAVAEKAADIVRSQDEQ